MSVSGLFLSLSDSNNINDKSWYIVRAMIWLLPEQETK
jgi:hypothetical protein